MGISYSEAKSLWQARLAGRPFESMAMIAHQQLFLHPAEVAELQAGYRKVAAPDAPPPLADYAFGEYIDRFCREYLGVSRLDIIDYSAYEGATIVHDMNQPVPDRLHNSFDVVLEAGSLEHIFAFPVAIANLMQMAKTGGTILLTTPANNLCGHGFYQFSPELMYRIFSPENGFEAPRVLFLEATFPGVELTPARGVFEVADPAAMRCRVGLRSKYPTMMMVEAKKVRHVTPFQTMPQQSDYVALWEQAAPAGSQARVSAVKALWRRVLRTLPVSWKRHIEGRQSNFQYSLANKNFYRKTRI
ncbi:MAG TPA: hypothetical protein VM120_04170 [Bryobacteraceae bacterium]|nr:hypothetical protein [Bryobacteraceae bacterium]